MSLLNVVVGDGIAWLCVDTTSRNLAAGNYCQQSKVVSIAHNNAVIAARGELSFLAHMFMNCFLAPDDNFDSLLSSWTRRLDEASTNYLAHAEAHQFDVSAFNHEILLLGWSNNRGQPVCLAAFRQSSNEKFAVAEVKCRIAPDPGRNVSSLSSLSAMEQLAKDQVQVVRRDHPEEPIGGSLLLAEVTRGQIIFRELARLD